MNQCASPHVWKNDRPRYQCSVGNVASPAGEFGEALDGNPVRDQLVHDIHLPSGDLYGVGLLAPGRRRTALENAIAAIFDEEFAGRVLGFDSAAARAFAEIAARRRRLGRPISEFDAQIAAIALANGATVATRNIEDFTDCGITVVSPWKSRTDAVNQQPRGAERFTAAAARLRSPGGWHPW